jgi:hypothetical protein
MIKEESLCNGQRAFILSVFNKSSETNPRLAVKQTEKLR